MEKRSYYMSKTAQDRMRFPSRNAPATAAATAQRPRASKTTSKPRAGAPALAPEFRSPHILASTAAMARSFVSRSRRTFAGGSFTRTVAKAARAAPASKWIPTFASDRMFGLHFG